jgi:6-phosphogluconolactonase (cycloisomerase 2 family)
VPDGRADRIDVFAVDARTGMLTATDHGLVTPKPATITFEG